MSNQHRAPGEPPPATQEQMMNETKFTPGPWKPLDALSTWIETVNDPYGHGRMHVADVRGWGHLTGQGACALDEDAAVDIQSANAHLIAAAPDLYAALETIVAVCGEAQHPKDVPAKVWLDAMAALKKARGQS